MPMEILKHIKQNECLSVACFVCLTKLKHQWLNSEVCSHVSSFLLHHSFNILHSVLQMPKYSSALDLPNQSHVFAF